MENDKLEARITALEETVMRHQEGLLRIYQGLQQVHEFQAQLIRYLNNESEFPGSGSPDRQDIPEKQEGEA